MERSKVRSVAEYLESEYSWDIFFARKECPKSACDYTTQFSQKSFCPYCGTELELESQEGGLDQLEEAINKFE